MHRGLGRKTKMENLSLPTGVCLIRAIRIHGRPVYYIKLMINRYDTTFFHCCKGERSCFTAADPGRNGVHASDYKNTDDTGKFCYNGGHFQAYAVVNPAGHSPSLKYYTKSQLADEVGSVLLHTPLPARTTTTPALTGWRTLAKVMEPLAVLEN